MAFGAGQQTQQADGDERWEKRDLVIVEGTEQTTKSGKVYWRVKDNQNHWYSVWEAATKVALEVAVTNATPIPCAVQIKPGNPGKPPFYTIVAAGPHAEATVNEGKKKSASSSAPGGRQSEFGRRMHPDDALRVTMLATLDRAISMVQMTLADKPEKTSYETFVKAKVVEYNTFLANLVNAPKTPTPDPSESTDTPVSNGQPPLPEYEPAKADEDIPF